MITSLTSSSIWNKLGENKLENLARIPMKKFQAFNLTETSFYILEQTVCKKKIVKKIACYEQQM